jgi:demethylmenaquinone methyltransferase/2-methoxy-6-polyprenyl-1,4-benzoquinol methylase
MWAEEERVEQRSKPAAAVAPDKHPEKIAGMFDAIARRYDLLNHLLSGGLDVYWRARAIRSLGLTGREVVLDLCTGTCDLAMAALRGGRPARRVLGLDFSSQMLRIGQRKLREAGMTDRAPLVRADAMRLPMAAGSVDVVTIGFGIRNVLDPGAACREIARVLRPTGRLAILEFSTPRAPVLRSTYLWYFRSVLPRVGRAISRHGDAYSYLPASVGAFLGPEEFSSLVAQAGLTAVRAVRLTFGVVYLYTAVKPADRSDTGSLTMAARSEDAPEPRGWDSGERPDGREPDTESRQPDIMQA